MNKPELDCPMAVTIKLIGGKWKPLIMWHLMNEPVLRFNQLCRYIDQVSPKMLTQQLRELEKDGLIIRTVYPVVPPKVEYRLSEFGKSMIPILKAMISWGENYLESSSKS